jgi:hypothetical protein
MKFKPAEWIGREPMDLESAVEFAINVSLDRNDVAELDERIRNISGLFSRLVVILDRKHLIREEEFIDLFNGLFTPEKDR